MKKTLIFTALLLQGIVHAQEVQDNRVVGLVSFASNNFSDSIAAKNIYATVSRTLIQTQRFTLLEIPEWKKTQEEIDRQKDAAFLDEPIVQKGKSLGAQVLAIGVVKNAEIYNNGSTYSARVDYDLKFVNVLTGKSIAAGKFSGNSENLANKSNTASNALSKLIIPAAIARPGNWKTVYLASAGLSALSESDRNTIKGKVLDAIEATSGPLNAWIRNTFNFNLLFLKVLEEDGKKGVQSVLIQGGEDMSMQPGCKLKMVLVTETSTSRGNIRDEEPVAELEVEQVRAETSKCKVTSGNKKVMESAQNKNMRIVFVTHA
jgi:hypothetical protein